MRGLIDGNAAVGEIALALLVSAGFLAIFAPLTMHFYHHKK